MVKNLFLCEKRRRSRFPRCFLHLPIWNGKKVAHHFQAWDYPKPVLAFQDCNWPPYRHHRCLGKEKYLLIYSIHLLSYRECLLQFFGVFLRVWKIHKTYPTSALRCHPENRNVLQVLRYVFLVMCNCCCWPRTAATYDKNIGHIRFRYGRTKDH